jgi:hypothetical protein
VCSSAGSETSARTVKDAPEIRRRDHDMPGDSRRQPSKAAQRFA